MEAKRRRNLDKTVKRNIFRESREADWDLDVLNLAEENLIETDRDIQSILLRVSTKLQNHRQIATHAKYFFTYFATDTVTQLLSKVLVKGALFDLFR